MPLGLHRIKKQSLATKAKFVLSFSESKVDEIHMKNTTMLVHGEWDTNFVHTYNETFKGLCILSQL